MLGRGAHDHALHNIVSELVLHEIDDEGRALRRPSHCEGGHEGIQLLRRRVTQHALDDVAAELVGCQRREARQHLLHDASAVGAR